MLELEIKKAPPRVLYIGSANSNPGIYYYQGLIDAGYRVYHVGDNSPQGFNTTNLPSKPYSIKTEVGSAQVRIKEFSLKSLLDIIGYDFDVIIHVQNWLYFTDHERSPIPYYFYCTEVAYPRVPRCAWHILSATEVIKKMNIRDCTWASSFLYHPHSIPVVRGRPLKYPKLKRTIKASFAGEMYSLPLYRPRRKIIKYLEKEVDGFESHYLGPRNEKGERPIEAGKGKLAMIQYTNLLLKSKCILNIPSIGGTNFRDVEALSTGGMLVTIETPDLLLMGIEDGVNCRTFKTKEEAKQIIENEYDPKIAKAGWELAHFGRNWWQHRNIDIAKVFRYKQYHEFEDPTKNYMEFLLRVKLDVEEKIKSMQNDGIITSYNITKEKLIVVPKTAVMIEPILQNLGMIEWHVDGHLIYHRLRELATYIYRNNGIKIPSRLIDLITTIKNKGRLSNVGLVYGSN